MLPDTPRSTPSRELTPRDFGYTTFGIERKRATLALRNLMNQFFDYPRIWVSVTALALAAYLLATSDSFRERKRWFRILMQIDGLTFDGVLQAACPVPGSPMMEALLSIVGLGARGLPVLLNDLLSNGTPNPDQTAARFIATRDPSNTYLNCWPIDRLNFLAYPIKTDLWNGTRYVDWNAGQFEATNTLMALYADNPNLIAQRITVTIISIGALWIGMGLISSGAFRKNLNHVINSLIDMSFSAAGAIASKFTTIVINNLIRLLNIALQCLPKKAVSCLISTNGHGNDKAVIQLMNPRWSKGDAPDTVATALVMNTQPLRIAGCLTPTWRVRIEALSQLMPGLGESFDAFVSRLRQAAPGTNEAFVTDSIFGQNTPENIHGALRKTNATQRPIASLATTITTLTDQATESFETLLRRERNRSGQLSTLSTIIRAQLDYVKDEIEGRIARDILRDTLLSQHDTGTTAGNIALLAERFPILCAIMSLASYLSRIACSGISRLDILSTALNRGGLSKGMPLAHLTYGLVYRADWIALLFNWQTPTNDADLNAAVDVVTRFGYYYLGQEKSATLAATAHTKIGMPVITSANPMFKAKGMPEAALPPSSSGAGAGSGDTAIPVAPPTTGTYDALRVTLTTPAPFDWSHVPRDTIISPPRMKVRQNRSDLRIGTQSLANQPGATSARGIPATRPAPPSQPRSATATMAIDDDTDETTRNDDDMGTMRPTTVVDAGVVVSPAVYAGTTAFFAPGAAADTPVARRLTDSRYPRLDTLFSQSTLTRVLKYQGTKATSHSSLVSKTYAPIQPFVDAYKAQGYDYTLAFLLTTPCTNQHEIDGALLALAIMVRSGSVGIAGEDDAFKALKRLFPTNSAYRIDTSKEVAILQKTQLSLLRAQQQAAREADATAHTPARSSMGMGHSRK